MDKAVENRIKSAAAALGMTQGELAKRIGMRAPSFSIAKAKGELPLERIAEVLNTTVDWLEHGGDLTGGKDMRLRYVGMCNTWVVMYDDNDDRYYALPMMDGFNKLTNKGLAELITAINEAEEIRYKNMIIGGAINGNGNGKDNE